MSKVNKIAAFLASPWRRPSAVKKRIGNSILGINPFGADKPADPALHCHAVEAIYKIFGDDEIWALRVATSIYVQKCSSINDIDRIVSEHAESRAGTFPAELFRGQGWAPDRALWFLADQADYWRGYVCLSGDKWISSESSLAQNDRFCSSGYTLSGLRGCVLSIILEREGGEEEETAVTTLANAFAIEAEGLIRNACGAAMPDALIKAIATCAAYDGVIGLARVSFVFNGPNRQDWTIPPAVKFRLCLGWSPPSI